MRVARPALSRVTAAKNFRRKAVNISGTGQTQFQEVPRPFIRLHCTRFMNRAGPIVVVATAVWGAFFLFSMTYGAQVSMPDNLYTDYGFPLSFATHTTVNIAGAVDQWAVDLNALTGDLIFWVLGMIALVVVLALLQRKSSAGTSVRASPQPP